MDKQVLIDALIAADNGRARSQQKAVGVSSLGDCRAKVWHMVNGTEPTNTTKRLPAIMGTAIHSAIETALAGSGFLLEHRVELPGLPPATIDCFDPVNGEVIDWKTVKLSGVPYFLSKQKRWQVQVYGYLMQQSGFDVRTVTLVGIPRDGDESDVFVHSEPFDEAVALEALAWLRDVESEPFPIPEREGLFCEQYCQFWGACGGRPKDLVGDPIVDETVVTAVNDYLAISEQLKDLDARKDAIKDVLAGVSGVTFDGVKVSWQQVAGRVTPDLDALKALGVAVPMKTGAASLRLTVKKG